MRLKKCYDTSEAIFMHDQDMNDNESGFAIGEDLVLMVSNEWIEDPLFYAHEFTEITVIRWFRRNRIPIRHDVRFDGFKATSVPHLVSDYGEDNQRNLNPQKNRDKVHEGLNRRIHNK